MINTKHAPKGIKKFAAKLVKDDNMLPGIEIDFDLETGEVALKVDLIPDVKSNEEIVHERLAVPLIQKTTVEVHTIETRPIGLQAAFFEAVTCGSRGGG